MAVRTTAQLKEWFSRGKYPTGEQFADLIDSFKPRYEKLTMTEVEGLDKLLNGGYSRAEGEALERRTEHSLEVVETLRDDYDNIWRQKGAAGGFAPLDDEGKLADEFLPAGARGAFWLRGCVAAAELEELVAAGASGSWYVSDREKIVTVEADGTETEMVPESGVIYVDEAGRELLRWTGGDMEPLGGTALRVVPQIAKTVTIEPGVLNQWGEVDSLTIDFAPGRGGYAAEYCIEFVSGIKATTLSLPAAVRFPEDPEIEANMRYQISVVNNVGLIAGVAI